MCERYGTRANILQRDHIGKYITILHVYKSGIEPVVKLFKYSEQVLIWKMLPGSINWSVIYI